MTPKAQIALMVSLLGTTAASVAQAEEQAVQPPPSAVSITQAKENAQAAPPAAQSLTSASSISAAIEQMLRFFMPAPPN